MDKALVLDGMWNKSLSAVRSLGRRGFYIAAGESTFFATALFSKYCKKKLVYPSPLSRPDEFLDFIENELRRGDYQVILPMEFSTQILLTSEKNRKRIERFARLPFPDSALSEKVNDKAFIMKYAKAMGIGIPETHYLSSSLGTDSPETDEIASLIKYPALIKPRVSSGSRGIAYVNSADELRSLYPKVHRRYPFPIIQEYIPHGGGSYGAAMLLNFSSEVRAAFAYRRLRSYPVAGGPSTLRESVSRQDLVEIAGDLLRSLGWTGVAHVEFKVDPRDGLPKLLEVNPRFWGSLELAVESGVDFPFLLYRLAVDNDVPVLQGYREGVRCRWLIPGDLLHFISNPGRLDILRDFLDLKIKDDILSIRDPFPTVGRILSVAGILLDKDMRKLLFRRDL
jgi:predicted ATP-grasp superfamily ATP-dependent carboligase